MELRRRRVLDMVRLLGFPEDRIKRVEEALAKYRTVDEAMDEIRKLTLEEYKMEEKPHSDPKRIVSEEELERHLADRWDVQTVLPSGRIDKEGCITRLMGSSSGLAEIWEPICIFVLISFLLSA